jgi:hypothetical protein
MNTELQTTLNSTVDAFAQQQDINARLLKEKEEFIVNFDNIQRERDRYHSKLEEGRRRDFDVDVSIKKQYRSWKMNSRMLLMLSNRMLRGLTHWSLRKNTGESILYIFLF